MELATLNRLIGLALRASQVNRARYAPAVNSLNAARRIAKAGGPAHEVHFACLCALAHARD